MSRDSSGTKYPGDAFERAQAVGRTRGGGRREGICLANDHAPPSGMEHVSPTLRRNTINTSGALLRLHIIYPAQKLCRLSDPSQNTYSTSIIYHCLSWDGLERGGGGFGVGGLGWHTYLSHALVVKPLTTHPRENGALSPQDLSPMANRSFPGGGAGESYPCIP